MKRLDSFIKQCLGVRCTHHPFQSLSISTATIDIRLPEDTNLDYQYLFESLPVVSKQVQDELGDIQWPPGTIIGAKWDTKIRGKPPTSSKKALKNSTMIWIWLEDKYVNVKISRNNLHVTGCKKLYHASEAVRYTQQHAQLISEKGRKVYDIYPYATRFDNHMINYNFNLEVALSLAKFDSFVSEVYRKEIFSSYDQNIHHTSMPLSYPGMEVKYIVNDNGQVSMCVSTSDIENAMKNAEIGYEFFFKMLEDFNGSAKL